MGLGKSIFYNIFHMLNVKAVLAVDSITSELLKPFDADFGCKTVTIAF